MMKNIGILLLLFKGNNKPSPLTKTIIGEIRTLSNKKLINSAIWCMVLATIFIAPLALAQKGGNLTGVPKGFRQHKDTSNEYSIYYPTTWEVAPNNVLNILKKHISENEQIILAVWSPDRKLNIMIEIEKIGAQKSLEELYEIVTKAAPLTRQNLLEEEVMISGVKAIKSVFSTTTPGGFPAKYVDLFFRRGEYIWGIGIGGNIKSFEENAKIIDKIIKSLVLGS